MKENPVRTRGRGAEEGIGMIGHKYDEWSMRDPRERDEKAKQQQRGRWGGERRQGRGQDNTVRNCADGCLPQQRNFVSDQLTNFPVCLKLVYCFTKSFFFRYRVA